VVQGVDPLYPLLPCHHPDETVVVKPLQVVEYLGVSIKSQGSENEGKYLE